MRRLIEDLIHILREASMSDEDRKDTELLRSILSKREKRSNAKLTPEEKAVLDKYGVSTNGGYVVGSDGEVEDELDTLLYLGDRSDKWNRRSGSYGKDNSSEVNLADLLRKRPQRRYAQGVNDTHSYFDPFSNDDSRTQAHKSGLSGDKPGHRMTFQDKERARGNSESPYKRDLDTMRFTKSQKGYYDSQVSNADRKKEQARREYEKKIRDIDSDAQVYRDASNSYQKKIDDIKGKYSRKNESIRRRSRKIKEDYDPKFFNIERIREVTSDLTNALERFEEQGSEFAITWNFGFDDNYDITGGVDIHFSKGSGISEEERKNVCDNVERLFYDNGFEIDNRFKPGRGLFGSYHYQIIYRDEDNHYEPSLTTDDMNGGQWYESLKESYSKQELVDAVQWNYGCLKSEALKKIKEMSEERKQLIVDSWKDQAKKSFYND